MTEVRVIAAWAILSIAGVAFIAMLISTWRNQISAAAGARRIAAELVWSLIPWLIVAMCMSPSAIRVLHRM